MTETLSHHEIEQLLPSAALEILEAQELASVTAHVRECDGCARLLASYREVVAGLATAVPEQPLPAARSARLRNRLLDRARERQGTGSVAQVTGARRAFSGAGQWAGWAVAAGLAGVLMIHHSVHRPVAYGWLIAGVLALVVVALGVYLKIQQGRLAALRRQVERETNEPVELQDTGSRAG